MSLDLPQAPFRIRDGIDVVLKSDLLSGVLKGQGRKPSRVGQPPSHLSLMLAPVTQQKTLKI
ncbi:hypothetical protein MPLSOD_410015 [Mesorhizobium sp. SOD10]|nr:hypothetical protein MPLSOD_410015 [Mesorhizobium sp. SOD10]